MPRFKKEKSNLREETTPHPPSPLFISIQPLPAPKPKPTCDAKDEDGGGEETGGGSSAGGGESSEETEAVCVCGRPWGEGPSPTEFMRFQEGRSRLFPIFPDKSFDEDADEKRFDEEGHEVDAEIMKVSVGVGCVGMLYLTASCVLCVAERCELWSMWVSGCGQTMLS